jgi:hypothetical protein
MERWADKMAQISRRNLFAGLGLGYAFLGCNAPQNVSQPAVETSQDQNAQLELNFPGGTNNPQTAEATLLFRAGYLTAALPKRFDFASQVSKVLYQLALRQENTKLLLDLTLASQDDPNEAEDKKGMEAEGLNFAQPIRIIAKWREWKFYEVDVANLKTAP